VAAQHGWKYVVKVIHFMVDREQIKRERARDQGME
jgi:hypothetical protein